MNKLLLLAFILFSALSFGQTLTGTALDNTTRKPLDRATITTADGKRTTVTNSQGKFAFSYPQGTKKVIIKHLGYTILTVDVNSASPNATYYLEPESYSLDEVVVPSIPIYEVIERIRANSVKHLQAPLVLNTYYREFININDTCRKFSDALLDYKTAHNKKATKLNSKIAIKQSRAAEIHTNVKRGLLYSTGIDTRGMIKHACNFYFIDDYFPNRKEYGKYKFTFEERTDGNGKPLTAIVFRPREEVHEYLYEGEIVYNPETELILNTEVHPAQTHTQYLRSRFKIGGHYTISDMNEKTIFTEINGTYMPAYSYIYGIVHTWGWGFDNTYKFTSDVIVTGSAEDLTTFYGTYTHRQLYDAGTNYTEKFWLNNNAMVLTAEEEAIIESLEKNNILENNNKQ
ncbi:hypothetical protein AM493_01900 [Flavobacterium akiainvivens]|uniref:Carboxypeptidase-like regulatory domain-containing protein n=1 Tax=Flavobacterium akiainvivens TaxID=1202724 RepID=A0A0M9VGX2_9FLAO|nr:carboxypeptidase-like regulatory domain-containing protein [Flavobacterium akiainvivens]KOS04926.1 hypothetical protein AM493_01900 [Flavobacterium akiainvivens]SFQ42039.1 CarboxypepD_reg-like domain-containing protein [Flavobacterium akiainvivens]